MLRGICISSLFYQLFSPRGPDHVELKHFPSTARYPGGNSRFVGVSILTAVLANADTSQGHASTARSSQQRGSSLRLVSQCTFVVESEKRRSEIIIRCARLRGA
jgi:hypothetical protein